MAKRSTPGAAPSTALAVRTEESANGFQKLSLSNNDPLPDLDKFNVAQVDLSSDYWTPEAIGETKRMVFQKLDIRVFKDEDTGEETPLMTAFFLAKEDGVVKSVTNSSKRLVAVMENMNIEKGTPLEIKYLGKKKNVKNSFSTDRWSVKPLFINVEAKSETAA